MKKSEKLSINEPVKLKPHFLQTHQVLAQLKTSTNGLTEAQTNNRLLDFGLNKLKEKKGYSIFSLIIEQFADFLIIILLVAGGFSFFIGEVVDAVAIFIIVIVNGILGFIQEFKAEKSLEALKKIETLEARVIRNGEEKTIEAEKIVPGDILALYEGEKIPADARLLEAFSLQVDESMLTGESLPVTKKTESLAEKTALADRKNMVYSGCLITKGRGKAVAVLTGMSTEIGKIAEEIHAAPQMQTPLQKALEKLGKILGIVCLAVAIPGLAFGIIAGRDWLEMVMMSISLAVSAIPEGLPIVVTIALALGIRRMIKVNVLIRKLSTAESLGSTDVICSDKTGTITHNQMTVNSIFVPKMGFFSLTGKGYSTKGKVEYDKNSGKKFGFANQKLQDGKLIKDLIRASVLCSDATLDFGDPTERALVVILRKINEKEEALKKQYPRSDEIPFDSGSKYMAVTVKDSKDKKAIVKGAPEVVFTMCSLSKTDKQKFGKINDFLSEKGLRVLAVAEKKLSGGETMKALKKYQFKGLIAMYDPPREEVPDALKVCQLAGVRVLMVTGDHKKTAEAIAKQIGLNTPQVLTGTEIDELSDKKFEKLLCTINVFARVSPPHKVKILKILQKMGHQVAMTGDGVNDAPAIKRADVGISVGSGTDLTKGISDMILLDDNFSTIPKGIAEGRRIFFNIKKFVRFLIAANFDEIAMVFVSIIFGIPLAFIPLQILWLNLATDSLPALALTSDVAEKGIMDLKPYHPEKEILRGVLPVSIMEAIIAFTTTYGLFLVGLYIWKLPLDHARTLAFTATVIYEFFLVFAIRSTLKSAWEIGFFSNPFLLFAIFVGLSGQMLAIYTNLGHQVFKTVSLPLNQLLLVFACASSGLIIMEILKAIKRRFPQTRAYIPTG